MCNLISLKGIQLALEDTEALLSTLHCLWSSLYPLSLSLSLFASFVLTWTQKLHASNLEGIHHVFGEGGGVLDCCENIHFVNPGIGSAAFFCFSPARSEFLKMRIKIRIKIKK